MTRWGCSPDDMPTVLTTLSDSAAKPRQWLPHLKHTDNLPSSFVLEAKAAAARPIASYPLLGQLLLYLQDSSSYLQQ